MQFVLNFPFIKRLQSHKKKNIYMLLSKNYISLKTKKKILFSKGNLNCSGVNTCRVTHTSITLLLLINYLLCQHIQLVPAINCVFVVHHYTASHFLQLLLLNKAPV